MWNLNNEIRLTLAKISNLGVFNYFSLSSHFTQNDLKVEFKRRSMGIEFTGKEQSL